MADTETKDAETKTETASEKAVTNTEVSEAKTEPDTVKNKTESETIKPQIESEKVKDSSETSTSKVSDGKPQEELTAPSDGKDLKISRGLRPDADIDFEKLRNLFVYDEQGNKICFSQVYQKQKTIIVFIRHFLDFITKEYVEDLAIIPLEYLQEADVRLVVIGPSPYKFIKPFRQLTGFHYTLYCDPDREIYKLLGLHEKMASGVLGQSKHVKSGIFMGVMKSMWRAMQYQEYQGNPKQQGGSFIMGPGDVVHFHHIDQNFMDHININDLLEEAGVRQVSFPKDQRVLSI